MRAAGHHGAARRSEGSLQGADDRRAPMMDPLSPRIQSPNQLEDADAVPTIDLMQWLDELKDEQEPPSPRRGLGLQLMVSTLYNAARGAFVSPARNVERDAQRSEARLREEFDFMRADCSRVNDAEMRRRFEHEVSITYGVSYVCPCQAKGGTNCMERCEGRDRSFLRRSRSMVLALSNRGPRFKWVIQKVEAAVAVDQSDPAKLTLVRTDTQFAYPGSRKRALKAIVHGVEVCPETFCNIYAVSPRQFERAAKALREAVGADRGVEHLAKRPRTDGPQLGGERHLVGDQVKTSFMVAWMQRRAFELADRDPTPRVPGDGEHEDQCTIYRFFERHYHQIYAIYASCCRGASREPYEYRQFIKIWKNHPELKNIKRARQKANFSICTECEDHKATMSNTRETLEGKTASKGKFNQHLEDQAQQRKEFDLIVLAAADPDSELLTISNDKMSTQSTSLPRSNIKANNTKARLKLSLFGGVVSEVGLVFTVGMPYLISGDNEVIEVLARQITYVLARLDAPNRRRKTHLVLQLDNCSDNKSKITLAFCSTLVYLGVFEKVTVTFLLRGHTHNICDQCFSIVERRLRIQGVDAHCWPRFAAAVNDAFQFCDRKPVVIEQATSNLDWEGWLGASVDPKLARHQMSAESGEDTHVFHFEILPGEREPRMFYKLRMGNSNGWLPRPFQAGDVFEDGGTRGQVLRVGKWEWLDTTAERNVIRGPTEGVWVIEVEVDRGHVVECRRRSPGIALMTSYPAIGALQQAADDARWKDQYRAIEMNVRRLLEHAAFQKHVETAAWWTSFFNGEAALEDRMRPLQYTATDLLRTRFTRSHSVASLPAPPPPPPPAAPPAPSLPPADPIQHSGHSASHRQRGVLANARNQARLSAHLAELKPDTFCMVRFEMGLHLRHIEETAENSDDESDESNEFDGSTQELLDQLGGYQAPVCLARLPSSFDGDTTRADTEITVTWYKPHNNTYSGIWRPWTQYKGTGSSAGTVWRSPILRENVIKGLEELTFTRSSTVTKQTLDKRAKERLRSIREVDYARYAGSAK